jgi:hypothetical protein
LALAWADAVAGPKSHESPTPAPPAASYAIREDDLDLAQRITSWLDGQEFMPEWAKEQVEHLARILDLVRSGYGGPRPEAEDQ